MTFGIDGAMRFNIREPPPIPAIPAIPAILIRFVPDRERRPVIPPANKPRSGRWPDRAQRGNSVFIEGLYRDFIGLIDVQRAQLQCRAFVREHPIAQVQAVRAQAPAHVVTHRAGNGFPGHHRMAAILVALDGHARRDVRRRSQRSTATGMRLAATTERASWRFLTMPFTAATLPRFAAAAVKLAYLSGLAHVATHRPQASLGP